LAEEFVKERRNETIYNWHGNLKWMDINNFIKD
jgi:hypothetical protein